MHIKKLIIINLNEKKNHFPERGIELTKLQISKKQGKLDLNTITTQPRRSFLEGASKSNIYKYSIKFH